VTETPVTVFSCHGHAVVLSAELFLLLFGAVIFAMGKWKSSPME
jgi:hypothetical protein